MDDSFESDLLEVAFGEDNSWKHLVWILNGTPAVRVPPVHTQPQTAGCRTAGGWACLTQFYCKGCIFRANHLGSNILEDLIGNPRGRKAARCPSQHLPVPVRCEQQQCSPSGDQSWCFHSLRKQSYHFIEGGETLANVIMVRECLTRPDRTSSCLSSVFLSTN